jgi:hypothetical protein
MTPLGAAATMGKAGGRPAFGIGIGIGVPPARGEAPLPKGTGILGGAAKGVGKLLARDVTPLTMEVKALSAEMAAGRLPVPLPSEPTHPLTTPN